jgi:hypothetical protein
MRAQKGRGMCPFRAPDGFKGIRLTLLERMAGTTRLELATSAVTVSHWKYIIDNANVYRDVYRDFLLINSRKRRTRENSVAHAGRGLLPGCPYSGIIPRSPPVGREGGHLNVVARRGRHWAVHQPWARSQLGIAWTPLTAPIWPVSQGSFWRSATPVALTLRSCT